MIRSIEKSTRRKVIKRKSMNNMKRRMMIKIIITINSTATRRPRINSSKTPLTRKIKSTNKIKIRRINMIIMTQNTLNTNPNQIEKTPNNNRKNTIQMINMISMINTINLIKKN